MFWLWALLATGVEILQGMEISAIPCSYAEQGVTVDGDLNEWEGLLTQTLSINGGHQIPQSSAPWDSIQSAEDCAMVWGICFDQENVYLAGQVTDDSIVVDSNLDVWQNDGIELRWDPYNTLEIIHETSLTALPADRHGGRQADSSIIFRNLLGIFLRCREEYSLIFPLNWKGKGASNLYVVFSSTLDAGPKGISSEWRSLGRNWKFTRSTKNYAWD